MGILFPAQAATAYVENFVLLAPVLTGSGFLANAAGSALQVRIAVLLGLAKGALTVGIAITAWPLFRRYSDRMALWFLALSAIGFALHAVEGVSILTMLSLSQEYAKGSGREILQTAALVARWMRYWAHYASLLIAGGTGFVLYGLLLRFALVPRALAAFGVVAVLLQITAVGMPVFGYPIVFPLLAPLGICQLLLSIWLIARGFGERQQVVPAAA
ncbi:MAG TPA: DUF4386 domain-containing protein [Myxococcales bacterium]|nr:DUF4386 domain-containing protein [Myxococcales bacterium]